MKKKVLSLVLVLTMILSIGVFNTSARNLELRAPTDCAVHASGHQTCYKDYVKNEPCGCFFYYSKCCCGKVMSAHYNECFLHE